MFQVPVFQAEIDAGIGERVRTSASIAYASAVRTVERFLIEEKAMARLGNLSKAKLTDADLHFFHSILVTVGWNKNDDVFDRLETWVARATPEHKPFNFVHVGDDIVGHMISASVIDIDGSPVADDTSVDKLPAKYHIVTANVLYKFWEDQAKQERMDTTLAEIAKGEWFVSMECLFKGFDFALKGPDGSCRLVARNEATAFLSKHLRCYGGTGMYGDYRVGRLLRNILFSGVGLVRNPANPESVILDTTPQTFDASKAEVLADFLRVSADQVYSLPDDSSKENDKIMAIELSDLQKQVDTLRTENEQLKAALKDNDLKAVKAKLDEVTADLTKSQEVVKTLAAEANASKAEATAAKAAVESINKQLAEVTTAKAELQDELKGLYADQQKKDRLAKLKAAQKVVDSDAEAVKAAEELNDSLAGLTNEQFASFLTSVAKLAPKTVAVTTTTEETTETSTAETESEGEENADTAALDAAKVDKTEANLTVTAGDGVNKLSKSIAAFCGFADDAK